MRIWSQSFQDGQPIPAEFAMGTPEGFGGNRNPQLGWDGIPQSTLSFALLCVDPDAPTVPETVGREDMEIPEDQPRADFVHWVLVDIPPEVCVIEAGSASDGITPKGKQAPPGPRGSRQGLNGYTDWFAGDADMGGDYYGYDGPYPPFNDARVHRYYFRLFALDVARLELPDRFTAADVLKAMASHVLGEAAVHGTYTLNAHKR